MLMRFFFVLKFILLDYAIHLKDKEIIRIIKYSKKVLKKAIKKGGSSIRTLKIQ